MAYSACDVFVLPSHQDNLPNTVMESLACGTPCVAYDVGGVSDMVEHGRNGLLVPPLDIDSLAQHIQQMLGISASARKVFQVQAVDKIKEQFNMQMQAKRMFELYQEVIERHHNP
jgi:glycosyltransferase involved in cell wall biosynthesis